MKNPFVIEILRCMAVGFGAAAAFVALVLAFDLGHLRALTFASPDGALALTMLFFFSGLSFSAAQCVFRNFPLFGGEDDDLR